MQAYFLRPRGCAQTSLLQIPKQLVNSITQDLLKECLILHGCLSNCYHFLWACGLWIIFNYFTIRLRFFLLDPSLTNCSSKSCLSSSSMHDCLIYCTLFTPCSESRIIHAFLGFAAACGISISQTFNWLSRCFWWDELSVEMVMHREPRHTEQTLQTTH